MYIMTLVNLSLLFLYCQVIQKQNNPNSTNKIVSFLFLEEITKTLLKLEK